MKPRDVLKEILEGKIDEDKADVFFDEVVEYIHSNPSLSEDDCWPSKWLCLTRVEWTAVGTGTPFTTVADWRKNGWPKSCFKCGKTIIPENFGWVAKEVNGKHLLKHLVCPKSDL